MSKSTEYFFPIKYYDYETPLRCNNNTVIEGHLSAFKGSTVIIINYELLKDLNLIK